MIRALTCVLLALTTAGCNGAGDAGDDGTASTGDATTTATVGESSTSVGTATATTDAETTGMTTAATEPPGMTGSTGEDTTTTGEDTTTTGEDTTTTGEDTTTGGEACVEPDFEPDPKGRSGESCFMDAECGDGEQCFVIPLLGGICGECLVDADCPDGGCTLPNPLAGVGAVCNTGKPGSGCESDEVCDSECNTICGVALDAVPIITVSTCGACGSSEDCSGGTICTPEVNLSEFSGINHCAAPRRARSPTTGPARWRPAVRRPAPPGSARWRRSWAWSRSASAVRA